MDHIFLCYSRKDIEFALEIKDRLEEAGKEVWIDQKDLPLSSIWRDEIKQAITSSIGFLYLVSKDSLSSKYCSEEFKFAQNLKKRIFPVLLPEILEGELKGNVSDFQWSYWNDIKSPAGLKKLVSDIYTDYEWLKFHTDLQVKASNWEDDKNKDIGHFLRGRVLENTEKRITLAKNKEPELTSSQMKFVLESRRSLSRTRRTIFSISATVLGALSLLAAFAYNMNNVANQKSLIAATAQTVSDQKTSISRSQALAGFIDKNKNSDQLNLLLSIESLNSVNGLSRADTLLAEQALRDNLSQVNGIPLVGKDSSSDLAFSPDGQWFAIGGYDNAVRLWKVQDILSEPITLEGHTNFITAVVFSPDGRWLASGSNDKTIFIWDMQNLGQSPIILSGHTDQVNLISFSPDSKWLASGSFDSTIRLWNMDNIISDPIILSKHTAWIESLVFSPDGNWLASSGWDNKVYLWNIADQIITPKDLYQDEFPSGNPNVFFSPDGEWLAIEAGADDELVNIKTMAIQKFNIDANLIAFSLDNKKIAATKYHDGLWNQVVLLSIENFEEEYIKELGSASTLSFSPDGKRLASVVYDDKFDYRIRIVDLQNPEKAIELTDVENSFTAIDFSPDSQWLAVGGGDITRLWNINNLFFEPKTLSTELSGTVREIAVSPDGRFLASGGIGEKGIYIWDLANPTSLPMALDSNIYTMHKVVFSFDNKFFADIDGSPRVELWKLANLTESFAELNNPRNPQETNREFINVVLSPDNKHIVTSDLNTVHLWDVENLSSDPAILLSSPFVGTGVIKYSPSGHWLVLFYTDTVYLWNMENFSPEPMKFTQSYLLNGNTVAFSPDDELLATGSDNGDIRIWKTEAFTEKPVIVYGHEAPVRSLLFSTDGKWLISTDDNYIVRVWDIENNFKEIVAFTDINQSITVRNVTISPNGRWVAAISSNTMINIWDLTDLTRDPIILNGHEDIINALQFSPDSKWLFSGGEDRVVRVWSMDRDYLLTLACQMVGRNLSRDEWNLYLQNEPYNKTCEQWNEGEVSQSSP